MIEGKTLKIMADDGKIKEYQILHTMDNPSLNKSYVVYTDFSKNANDEIITYTSSYNANDEYTNLEPVLNQEELDLINAELKNKLNE